MKIVADENIPFAQTIFQQLGDVTLLPGRGMTAACVRDADVLLVRSVTEVNRALLEGSKVGFVGTCTIGTDHLDIPYLEKNNITYRSAPGCNANGVVQYVLAALAALGELDDIERLPFKKVAIVGCGNVGGRLYQTLSGLGFDCTGIDPFLAPHHFAKMGDWSAILDADIICVHTPLTRTGDFPTEHLFREATLAALKPNCVLLNAGRGGAIHNRDLSTVLASRKDLRVVLDVWESEPDILRPLLQQVTLATPHIAGYSFEGRTNGTLMIFEALAQHLGWDESKVKAIFLQEKHKAYGDSEMIFTESLKEAILSTYAIQDDHQRLLDAEQQLPSIFDYQRKHYPKRREFSHYRVQTPKDVVAKKLEILGFSQ